MSDAYYQLRDYPKLIEVSRQGVTSYPNEWTNHRELGKQAIQDGQAQVADEDALNRELEANIWEPGTFPMNASRSLFSEPLKPFFQPRCLPSKR
jgi:hypothetical protein